jgi:hypothetical protein
VIVDRGIAVPLAAILAGVSADARPTGVTSGATAGARLTGIDNSAIGNGLVLA